MNTKHALVALVGCALCIAPWLHTVNATTVPTSGSLIKGSINTVYYLGADNKRYVFPNSQTYFSWYTDFSRVNVISDIMLQSYPLGGNVTYRPGVRLVKVTTDPKVYAVDHNGMLRWIETEDLANALYGHGWAHQVDDLPDAFFVNYHVDAPIASISDYSPNTVTQNADTINDDKQLSATTPPVVQPPIVSTPTSTPPITSPIQTTSTPPVQAVTETVTSSNTNPHAGDVITITAQTRSTRSLRQVEVFFNNALQTTCASTPCATGATIPTSGTQPNYDIGAIFNWMDGQVTTVTSSIAIATSANNVVLNITRTSVRPGTSREIVVDTTGGFTARTIDIYLDGSDIKGCTAQNECRYSDTEGSAIGTVHTVYAIATDSLGAQRITPTQTITVVSTEPPLTTISTDKTFIYHGENVDVSVNASAGDNAVSSTEIWINGSLLKRCIGSLCDLSSGPWNTAGTLTFVGHAIDASGLEAWATSTQVTVQ